SSTTTMLDGETLVRARAFVAHDSYERLISVDCKPQHHTATVNGSLAIPPISEISDPLSVGLQPSSLQTAVESDEGIKEFSRFYVERRGDEVAAAANDPRKVRKLEEEYTPRLESTVVGIRGHIRRCLNLSIVYQIEGVHLYTSQLTVFPSRN